MSACNATREISYEAFQAECQHRHVGELLRKDLPTRGWRIPAELVSSLRDGSLVMCDVPSPKKRWAEMSDSESEVDVDSHRAVAVPPPKTFPAAKGPHSSRKIANKPIALARATHAIPTVPGSEEASERSSNAFPADTKGSRASMRAAQKPIATVPSEDHFEQPPSSRRRPFLLKPSGNTGAVAVRAPVATVPTEDLVGTSSNEVPAQRQNQVRRGVPNTEFWQPSLSSLAGLANLGAKAAKPSTQRRGRDSTSKFQCWFEIGIEEEAEFRVVRRIIGPAGASVKAIALETSAKLRLRGRGSKFLEGPERLESTDALMLCVSAPSCAQLATASRNVSEILERVYAEYEAHRALKKLRPLGLRVQINHGPRKGAR